MVRARDMRSRYRHWDIYVGSRRLIVYCELPAEISRGHHSSDSHITSFKNRFCLREKGYQSHEPSVISPARLPCLRDESHRSGAAAVTPTACKPDPRNNSLLSGLKRTAGTLEPLKRGFGDSNPASAPGQWLHAPDGIWALALDVFEARGKDLEP